MFSVKVNCSQFDMLSSFHSSIQSAKARRNVGLLSPKIAALPRRLLLLNSVLEFETTHQALMSFKKLYAQLRSGEYDVIAADVVSWNSQREWNALIVIPWMHNFG